MKAPPPDETETYDVGIHGKLSHLDAVDLSKLSLNKRYVMITLSGPWASDDFGRFTTSGGAYPRLPGLSDREALVAVRSLIKESHIRTWIIGGTTCWEVAGAYAFKPGLKQAKWERKQLAISKRKEKAKRRERKKENDAGIPFAKEDDGGGAAEDGAIITEIRTKRGNVVPERAGLWFRSSVPVPKGEARDKMLLTQPDRSRDINLRMLPPINPSEGLSVLGTILRHYLLMDCDDYGRVRLDVPQLYQQLGNVITKRISRAQVEAELAAMIQSAHLMEIRKKSGRFAFVRDSAQHLLDKKRYHRDIPRLMDGQGFTHNSKPYLAFFDACTQHATTRTKVQVAQYTLRGDIHVVNEYLNEAKEQFLSEYQRVMKTEDWLHATPQQFCIGDWSSGRAWEGGPYLEPIELRLWHAINSNLPVAQIEEIHRESPDTFDGTNDDIGKNRNTHKIFTALLGMTPKAYIEKRKTSELLDPPPPPPPPPPPGSATVGSHEQPDPPMG